MARRGRTSRPRRSVRQAGGASDPARSPGSEGSGRPPVRRSDSKREEGEVFVDEISLDLTPAQIQDVLRQTAEEGGIAGALNGLGDHRELARAYRAATTDPQLSSSLLFGLVVLACFRHGEMGVLDVARRLGANVSTVHRYIKTLLIAGLLEQNPTTRRYRRVRLGCGE
jgi:IclR helix-turn-helix domain